MICKNGNQRAVMAQRIVITGGATGIGFEIAKQLASCSHDLILLSRNEQRLAKVSEQLAQEHGVKVDHYAYHLRDESHLQQTVEKINAHDVFGLVNNAAANFICPTENISANAHAIFDTVAVGTFLLSKMFGEHWIKANKPGSILSISATYAAGAGPYVVPSAMGKAAVEAMTRSLAVGGRIGTLKLMPFRRDCFQPQVQLNSYCQMNRWLMRSGNTFQAGSLGDCQTWLSCTVLLLESGEYLTGEVIRRWGIYHASGTGPFFDMLRKLPPEIWQLLKKALSELVSG